MTIKGAIFDFDGTLMESMGIWEKIDERFLGSRGLEVPPDFGKTIALMTFEQVCHYVVEHFGLQDTPQELYSAWFAVAREAYENEVSIKPGAKEYLERLQRQGIAMAVASASDLELIAPCLKAHGIDGYFQAVVTTGAVSAAKDSPRIYETAARALGLRNQECAVFEDILLGIRTAAAAGFKTVGVYDDYSKKDHILMQKEADWFIMNFGEMEDWIG